MPISQPTHQLTNQPTIPSRQPISLLDSGRASWSPASRHRVCVGHGVVAWRCCARLSPRRGRWVRGSTAAVCASRIHDDGGQGQRPARALPVHASPARWRGRESVPWTTAHCRRRGCSHRLCSRVRARHGAPWVGQPRCHRVLECSPTRDAPSRDCCWRGATASASSRVSELCCPKPRAKVARTQSRERHSLHRALSARMRGLSRWRVGCGRG
jgi:hypothetical protein